MNSENSKPRRLTFLPVHALALTLLVSINASAQDRATIEREIEALREQLKQKEIEFLAPSPEDRAAFADFLRQPDTGLARLLPREKYREKLSVREGGAYYSFTRLSNSYNDEPQIGLEQGMLHTGFAGADFGILSSLGGVSLTASGRWRTKARRRRKCRTGFGRCSVLGRIRYPRDRT